MLTLFAAPGLPNVDTNQLVVRLLLQCCTIDINNILVVARWLYALCLFLGQFLLIESISVVLPQSKSHIVVHK